MNSQRELFQKELLENWGSDYHDFYGFASGHGQWSYSDHRVNALWLIWQAATEQGMGETTVPMPTTVAQAKGMALVGTSWLEANAPEELKPTGGGVPAGWKLVPIEPTKGMLVHTFKEMTVGSESNYKEIWSAMLEATPKPPED